jgi:ABC-2 type transport system ATP-binding protein
MTDTPADAVRVTGLRKSFHVKGVTVAALTGIDLAVAPGEIFGLLGPNGAGKTTTLRILTTLLPADAGEARVAGADVRRDPALVRRRIGYVGQLGGADLNATGRENLLLAGRLYGLSAGDANRRCAELLGVFGLAELADRAVRTYSGGQRRRLEVALGVMHRPRVLFLDEPSTGLDPQNRANLWDQIRELREGGTTVFITTHYLDEADQLSDRVAIVDHGRVIALGSPEALKRQYSGDTITITPDIGAPGAVGDAPEAPGDAVATLAGELSGSDDVRRAVVENGAIRLTVTDPPRAMAAVLGVLAASALPIQDVSVGRPSLDDVFLRETGRSLRDTGEDPASAATAEAADAAEVAA